MFVQIKWKPDKTVATPLYLQIKDYIQMKLKTVSGLLGQEFLLNGNWLKFLKSIEAPLCLPLMS